MLFAFGDEVTREREAGNREKQWALPLKAVGMREVRVWHASISGAVVAPSIDCVRLLSWPASFVAAAATVNPSTERLVWTLGTLHWFTWHLLGRCVRDALWKLKKGWNDARHCAAGRVGRCAAWMEGRVCGRDTCKGRGKCESISRKWPCIQ